MKKSLKADILDDGYIDYIIDETIKWNTSVGIDGMTYKQLNNTRKGLINNLKRDILQETYEFSEYREVLFIKNRYEPPRCISIPTLRDKICLKIIHLFLYSSFLADISKQEIPQTHIKNLKAELNNYEYFIKIDIEKFYNNLNHEILKKQLSKNIDYYEVGLVMKAVLNETNGVSVTKGVPQGVSISNILSDIYMMDFDKEFSNRDGIYYIRYVDDILILCNKKDSEELKEKLKTRITDTLKLSIHKDKFKTGYINNSFEFLGYKTYWDVRNEKVKMTIKDSGVKNIEKKLIKVIQIYKYSNRGDVATKKFIHSMNLIITGAITKKLDSMQSFYEKRYGWLFFYSQLDGVSVLYHLDDLVKRKVEKVTPQYRVKEVFDEATGIKKFTKAFREIRYNYKNTKYIFRPDNYNLVDQISYLRNVEGYHDSILKFNDDDNETLAQYESRIESNFRKHVYTVIEKQEKDILKMIS